MVEDEPLNLEGARIKSRYGDFLSDEAKASGRAAASLEQLVCHEHPQAKFVLRGTIPGYPYGSSGQMETYRCEVKGCLSRAYECPSCGIVGGECYAEDYRSSEESWMQLAGREGEQYFCRACGTKLGETIDRMSAV